jgi:Tol biopolymer transport system component/DNA-binding winged helix-turn-helix (wHTH) protein
MKFLWDDFVLDPEAYRLERAGVALPLEPKAFNVLVLLVQRAGKLVTKQEILDVVWPQTAVTDYALTRVVAQLRKTLGDEVRETRFIETVPTRGYRWIRPLRTPSLAASDVAAEIGAVPAPATIRPRPSRLMWGEYVRGVEGIAAAVVIVIFIAGYLVSSRQAQPATTAQPVATASSVRIAFPEQLTTGAGLDLQPTLSPQGDAVAYSSDRSGALEIYVRALTGTSTETPLTQDGGENAQPAWSPDGTMVAFHSYKRGGVWVVPSRGGVPRQVAAVGSNPAWSPDGTRIAFQTDEFTDISPNAFAAQIGSVIAIVNVDGSGQKHVTSEGNPGGGHGVPAWSPDGTRISFVSFDGGPQNGIWTVNLDANVVRQLTLGNGLYELAYAPDGSAIYSAGGEALLVRLPIDPRTGDPRGAREVIPIPGVAAVRSLSITADGKRLAFASLWLDSQIWAQPVNTDGTPNGPARPLTNDRNRRNSLPVIAPDGARIAYMSTRQGQPPNISVLGIDGGTPLQVTSDESSDAQPNWFPDARRIAYVSTRRAQQGLWSVDIETRREELMMDIASLRRGRGGGEQPTGRLAEMRMSSSMKKAAFSMITAPYERRTLYTSALTPFAPKKLTDGTQSVGYPAWSPDERLIAVEVKVGSAMQAAVVDADNGRMQMLTSGRDHTWVRGWSPDSQKITAATLHDGHWSLRWIDARTGAMGIIVPEAPVHVYLRYPDWSSRGNVVVFERGEVEGNIWSIRLHDEAGSSAR